MPKLTETFNDKAKQRKSAPPVKARAPRNNGKLHIEAAHEPLESETGLWLDTPNFPTLESVLPPPIEQPVAPEVGVQPLKVALVGTAPSSRLLAPYHDKTWTIWGCSPGNMGTIPKWDAWFEVHANLLWPKNKHYGEPYINWLKTHSTPVYMHGWWPMPDGTKLKLKNIIPNAKPLPTKKLVEEFGDEFFTSSFAWMMAMALQAGAKEIALYGIDMASREEYIIQRPGFYYFKREATRRGCRVHAPYESDIMQSPGLYGFSEITPLGRKIIARKEELTERIAQIQPELQRLRDNEVYLKGALEDVGYFESIWTGAQEIEGEEENA